MNLHNYTEKEKKIVNIIKYTPLFFILLFGVVISLLLYFESKNNFELEKKYIIEQFTKAKKQKIKNEVINVKNYLSSEASNMEDILKSEIKESVYMAHAIMQSIYEKNYKTKTKAQITQLIKDALQEVRFNNGRGYFFIYDLKATNIFHPTKPHREGKNYFYDKDITNTYRNQIAVNIIKAKGEGFFHWFFHKPDDTINEHKKIGFVKHFKEYNWFVGTGEYVEDFTKEIQEYSLKYIQSLEKTSNSNITIMKINGDIILNIDPSKKGINNIKKVGYVKKPIKSFKKLLKIVKNNGGYLDIDVKKDLKIKNKVVYAEYFDKWDWIIASGYFEEELKDKILQKKELVNAKFFENIKKVLILSVITILVLLVISFIISKVITRIFDNYREDIKNQIDENENQRKNLINAQRAAHIGNWEFDIKTKKVYWSDEIIKIFGLENIKFKPGPEFLKTIMFNEDIPCFESSLKNVINSGIKHHCTYRVLRPDGDVRWIDCIGTYDAKTDKILGTVQDISELKEKDEMLITQSRHAAMGEMIGMIAHQWRQPLSVISMEVNNMLVDIALENFNEDEAQNIFKNILQQTSHLSKTIDDFRNFIKPDKETTAIEISKILDETYEIVKDSLKNNNIEFKKDYKEKTLKVNAYPRELMQVFVNIINNAKDALVQNNIKEPKIEVKIYSNSKYVNIDICDNAGGIDSKIMDKIFEPYFTTKNEKNGTGIGLYMSKMIIQSHLSGIIKAFNINNGACLRVALLKDK